MAHHVEKTDEQWRAELTPEEYQVLRKAGTERAFTGEYTDTETTGVYRCKACQAKLFESDTKFHSGCGRSGGRARWRWAQNRLRPANREPANATKSGALKAGASLSRPPQAGKDDAVGVPGNLGEFADHDRLAARTVGGGHRGPHSEVELAAERLDETLLVLGGLDVSLGEQHIAVPGSHSHQSH